MEASRRRSSAGWCARWGNSRGPRSCARCCRRSTSTVSIFSFSRPIIFPNIFRTVETARYSINNSGCNKGCITERTKCQPLSKPTLGRGVNRKFPINIQRSCENETRSRNTGGGGEGGEDHDSLKFVTLFPTTWLNSLAAPLSLRALQQVNRLRCFAKYLESVDGRQQQINNIRTTGSRSLELVLRFSLIRQFSGVLILRVIFENYSDNETWMPSLASNFFRLHSHW